MKKFYKLFYLLIIVGLSSCSSLQDKIEETIRENAGILPQFGPAGCGWGTSLFSGNFGKGSNVLASITNSTTQPFAISSGTSGCGEINKTTAVDPLLKASLNQKMFIAVNKAKLIEQMSAGSGEFLTAYGQLFGCSSANEADFSEATQANFGQIFSDQNNDEQILSNTKAVIKADEKLSASCSLI